MKSGKKVIEDIVRRRKIKGLSAAELARRVGISRAAQSRYEKGERNFPVNDIDKYAAALGTTVPELLGINEENKIGIPYYDSVSAGALATVEGHTDRNTKTLEMPPDLLGKYAHCSGLFAMRVNGESMNKIIPNGSYVIAIPEDHFKDGDIVIFSHDGEYALKRYLPHTIAGSLLFKAETTDKRIKDIVIPMSSDLETKIYGRVIWYSVTLP